MAPDDRRTRLSPARRRLTIAFAGSMASVLWPTLIYEMVPSIATSMAQGHSRLESIFLFFHFFSILTNIGIAVLMSVTAMKLVRGHPLLPAAVYNGGLIYILVTGVTYELLLRQVYSPHDLRAISNAIIHDVVPTLTLLFWLAFAPREGTRWSDAMWMLIYPALYLALTLTAGALGQPYPYSFLDVNRLGAAQVARVVVGFLIAFSVLGLVTTTICKTIVRVRGGRSAMV